MEGFAVREQDGGFVVDVTMSEAHLKGAFRALRPAHRKAITAFSAACGVVGALSLLRVIELFNSFMSVTLLLYAGLYLYMQNKSEGDTAKQMMERFLSASPPDVRREYTFASAVTAFSPASGSRQTFSYDAVKRFRSTRQYYLFVTGGNTVIALPKGIFSEEEKKRFEQMMHAKLKR